MFVTFKLVQLCNIHLMLKVFSSVFSASSFTDTQCILNILLGDLLLSDLTMKTPSCSHQTFPHKTFIIYDIH